MSGTSFDGKCPRCGRTLYGYSDWKPVDTVSVTCHNCGLSTYTVVRRLGPRQLKAAQQQYIDCYEEDYVPTKFSEEEQKKIKAFDEAFEGMYSK